jgi:asparagine synthase (glutamine-hydrolysing)
MSVQFGVSNRDGEPVGEEVLRQIEDLLVPYAPDGVSVLRQRSSALLYGSFETGCNPAQLRPQLLATGDWMTWDGRLDNRNDLIRASLNLTTRSTDVEIVASAYERLGFGMFSQLIGDWAISIFSEDRQEVVLAKDFIGARSLFYRADDRHLAWSTVLEPLVLLEGGAPKLSEPYVAGWLSSFPRSGLTPYECIFSVPASSTVRIRHGQQLTVSKYWDLDPAQTIHYRHDRDYEEQFRCILRESVRRRIVSTKPVLAELSGGIDSSSIVCMADSLLAGGESIAPRLDTVTYYDSAEPNWDELPYAQSVEQTRGRTGSHIDVGPHSFEPGRQRSDSFRILPTSPYARSSAADSFSQLLADGGYRAVLSGLGGDEILGGVPTPLPELADLLLGLEPSRFVRQSFRWAFAKRKPLVTLWSTLLRQFLPQRQSVSNRPNAQLTWLTKAFADRCERDLCVQLLRTKLTGTRPSFQANLFAVDSCRSQLSCMALESNPAYEWRYPLLDRDLVSFCISIPREQMVRPHERRSLMRRALADMVPREILDRRRKAYVSRALVKVVSAEYARLRSGGPFLTEELGIVNCKELQRAVQNAEQGRDVATVPLLRTLALEDWLRSLRARESRYRDGVVPQPFATHVVCYSDQKILGRENQTKRG